MTDSPLPQNIRDWPEDPSELLGVGYDADRKTLRRAYSRLVRHYKPEHAPEEFQRIRDAYESMLQSVQWRERFEEYEQAESNAEDTIDDHPEDDPPQSEITDSDSSEEPIRRTADGIHSTNGNRHDPPSSIAFPGVDDIWQKATEGNLELSYRELCHDHERRPGREETCIRLYWLLKVAPHLDNSREPVDWLIKALKQNGLSDWAFGLYRDELQDRPNLVRRKRTRELFHVPAAPWRLCELARVHWTAAATLQDWQTILDSLDVLRPRIVDDDTEAWVRLLFAALDHLCWVHDARESETAAAISRIRSEIRSHDYLQLSMSYDFDRCEFLLHLTGECSELYSRSLNPQLADLLRYGWNRSGGELRQRLHRLTGPWIRNPAKGLGELDRIAERSPAVLERLVEMYDSINYQYVYFEEKDAALGIVRHGLWNLLVKERWPSYQRFRPSLRDFCLAEALPLGIIENTILSDPEPFAILDDAFVHELSEDAALDCLLRANLAFWS